MAQPSGLAGALDGSLEAIGPESGLFLERRFSLAPGEQSTLYFLYGYLPQGADAASLIGKYRSSRGNGLERLEPRSGRTRACASKLSRSRG